MNKLVSIILLWAPISACRPTGDVNDFEASSIILPPDTGPAPTCPSCVDDPNLPFAFFGPGSDGDFQVNTGTTLVLTHDTFFARLFMQDGATLVTNGFALRVSKELIGPSAGRALIAMNGHDAIGGVGGGGLARSGSFAGSATGGTSSSPDIGKHGHPDPGGDASALGPWPSPLHPGNGGNGGQGIATLSGFGGVGSLVPDTAGAFDVFMALRMRYADPSIPALAGGAGGAAGGGNGVDAPGGGGGGGAGNLSVAARQIVNAGNVTVSARGGNGGSAFGPNAGGGGGGGGGLAIVAVYRLPLPVVVVAGGLGGAGFDGQFNSPGLPGGDGTAITFSFVP